MCRSLEARAQSSLLAFHDSRLQASFSEQFSHVSFFLHQGLPHMLRKNYFEMRLEPLEVTLAYYYFVLKIYDLFETLIFVLRKKQSQVSFLHVYHHVMVIIFIYFGMRSLPGNRMKWFFFVVAACSKLSICQVVIMLLTDSLTHWCIR